MTRRHSRAWHKMHDAALQDRLSPVAPPPAIPGGYPPSVIDAMRVDEGLPLLSREILAGRHEAHAERSRSFRQTGNVDD